LFPTNAPVIAASVARIISTRCSSKFASLKRDAQTESLVKSTNDAITTPRESLFLLKWTFCAVRKKITEAKKPDK